MKLNVGKTSLKINVSFAAVVTFSLILDESGICAVALLCCIVHEAGHIICLLIMGEQPKLVELSFYGIKLERSVMPSIGGIDEIIVYASGPAVNLIFSAILFIAGNALQGMKTAAIISLCVGLFNLIPCRPLDGGNILFSALSLMLHEGKAERFCALASVVFIVPMAVAGVAFLLKSGNVTLLAVSVYLAAAVFLNKKEKEKMKL